MIAISRWFVLFCLICSSQAWASDPGRTVKPVAVFDLNLSGIQLKRTLTTNLSDYLSAVLTEGGFATLSAGELRSRWQGMKKGKLPRCTDVACRAQVVRDVGLDRFVSAGLMKVGSKCTIVLRLFNEGVPGAIEAHTAQCSCTEDSLMAGLDKVVAKLLASSGQASVALPPAGRPVVEEVAVDMGGAGLGKPGTAVNAVVPSGDTGSLSLNSVPWGRVWFDGQDSGLNTPLQNHVLKSGPHQVEVRLSDGQKLQAEVEIWPGESSTLILRSDKGQVATHGETGWLSVNTRPWSDVNVDGKHIGMTPLRQRLQPGKHEVRLSFSHGEVKTQDVQILPGQTTRLVTQAETPGSFKFRKGQGLLKLHSSPWSRVWIDGRDSGKATPLFHQQLAAGTHRLTIHFSTGGFMSEEVVIREGETTRKVIRER